MKEEKSKNREHKRESFQGSINVVKMVPPGFEPGTLTTWKWCDNQLHHETAQVISEKEKKYTAGGKPKEGKAESKKMYKRARRTKAREGGESKKERINKR